MWIDSYKYVRALLVCIVLQLCCSIVVLKIECIVVKLHVINRTHAAIPPALIPNDNSVISQKKSFFAYSHLRKIYM